MILQKLASAIRRQDWFQVLVEVLIVIVGIFLGLQVQEWNEQRKGAIAAQEYSAQLLIDSRLAIETIENALALKTQRADAISEMLHILKGKALNDENEDLFRYALEHIRYVQPPDIIVGNVADVIKGELPNFITNAAILRSATEFEQQVAISFNRLDHGREMLNNHIAILDRFYSAQLPQYVLIEELDELARRYYHSARYDVEQLRSTPEVINVVQEALRIHLITLFQTRLVQGQLEQFLAVLEAAQ